MIRLITHVELELDQKVRQAADDAGMTTSSLIRRILAEYFDEPTAVPARPRRRGPRPPARSLKDAKTGLSSARGEPDFKKSTKL